MTVGTASTAAVMRTQRLRQIAATRILTRAVFVRVFFTSYEYRTPSASCPVPMVRDIMPGLRCSSLKCSRHSRSSRLAIRAPRSGTYATIHHGDGTLDGDNPVTPEIEGQLLV